MKYTRAILCLQAIFYLFTALWPLVNINSFMHVTGQKTDVCLVHTVAVLVLLIAVTFLSALISKAGVVAPVLVLAMGTCIVLSVIDFYYVNNNTLPNVYLADAAIEILLLLLYSARLIIPERIQAV